MPVGLLSAALARPLPPGTVIASSGREPVWQSIEAYLPKEDVARLAVTCHFWPSEAPPPEFANRFLFGDPDARDEELLRLAFLGRD